MLIAERGRKFQNWNAYSLRSGKTTVPIGCGKAFCASQQQYLPFSALLTWSQLFSSLLMSPELFSPLLSSSELFSFQLFSASPFYAAPLNSSLLSSSLLFSALRQLLSSHLILAHLFRSTHVKSSDSRCSNPFSIFLLQFISSSVIFLSWLAWPHASVVHQAFPSLLISCQEKQEKITLTQQSGFG